LIPYQVLVQYGEGWCIERGSTLCFYDSRYFFLKFKRPGESGIKMHWNLPPHMNEKYHELRNLAEQPEEQIRMSLQIFIMKRRLTLSSLNAGGPNVDKCRTDENGVCTHRN
jgi:hypothetical protein